MIKSFEDEIEFNKENIPDVLYLFFDEVELVINDSRYTLTFKIWSH